MSYIVNLLRASCREFPSARINSDKFIAPSSHPFRISSLYSVIFLIISYDVRQLSSLEEDSKFITKLHLSRCNSPINRAVARCSDANDWNLCQRMHVFNLMRWNDIFFSFIFKRNPVETNDELIAS